MVTIYIDGDASPVKAEVIEVASAFNYQVVIVASIDHLTHQRPSAHVRQIFVDRGTDAADFKIISLMQSGDVLITQDYGLASLALNKGRVFHHNGKEYHSQNIDYLLMQRHLSAQARKAGIGTKGPSKFTQADREKFKQRFRQALAKGGLQCQLN